MRNFRLPSQSTIRVYTRSCSLSLSLRRLTIFCHPNPYTPYNTCHIVFSPAHTSTRPDISSSLTVLLVASTQSSSHSIHIDHVSLLQRLVNGPIRYRYPNVNYFSSPDQKFQQTQVPGRGDLRPGFYSKSFACWG